MRRNVFFIIPIFVIISILSGCHKSIDFVEDEPFILLTNKKGGENYYVDFYPKNIAVYSDGTIWIYTERTEDIIVEDDAPEVHVQITDEEVEEIQKTIEKNNFFQLEEDLSDPGVMDGPSQYVTVYAKTESKRVGGEWPIDENFQAIREVVLDHVREEYDQWLDDIEEYIYEVNPGPND